MCDENGGAVMLDLNSSIGSLLIVLFMFGLITGFGTCVTLLISRIWGEESHVAEAHSMSTSAEASPLPKAA
jgi:hypothetical protein